ncbi:putative intracellular protease/amidase [Paucibacter oligotrophus]|uniref:Putative intracellular protease/amidase n=1 Tax=Roseateles oligotrophus TaxID=1769250 RepID=A0A840LDB0_9BURK|nr:DJ-1/PfpI family protein [Roseateles oligotrophus]MBB4846156.1 putative intracellular protease/amidase [Roseateles oligotrophus]
MQDLLKQALAGGLLAAAALAPGWAAQPAGKVLIVVSSEGREQGKTRPGFEMDEFAQAGLKARDYRAVLVMGGKGAMFDLPKDGGLLKLLSEMEAQGGVIAAVCHGPAALAGSASAITAAPPPPPLLQARQAGLGMGQGLNIAHRLAQSHGLDIE